LWQIVEEILIENAGLMSSREVIERIKEHVENNDIHEGTTISSERIGEEGEIVFKFDKKSEKWQIADSHTSNNIKASSPKCVGKK